MDSKKLNGSRASGARRASISVAMTTYNGAAFVAQQLDSIFAQTRLPDELVVCDDRSSDRTVEILRHYAAKAPFPMLVFVNDEQLGSTRNFEKAIRACRGDIIALCDQDDVWQPHKLAVIEERLAAEPDLGAVMTNAGLIDANGSALPSDLWSRCRVTKTRQEILAGPRPYDLLLGFPVATGATMAFRASFLPLLLPFPVGSPTFIHDRWIAVLIAAVARLGVLPDKLISYRLHQQQQLGVGKIPLPLRVFMPHLCKSDAAALAALSERLNAHPEFAAHADFWRALGERQQHIDQRARFSSSAVRRVAQVASEVRTGRYVNYPYRFIVPVKDVLVGTR